MKKGVMLTIRRRKQNPRVSSARAFYRLAAKALKGGQPIQHDIYRKQADRLMDQYHREQARRSS